MRQFLDHCIQGYELYQRKNEEYSNSYESMGLLGVCCDLIGIAARLYKLVLWDPGHGKNNQEALENVLIDLHNYAVLGRLCLERHNWDGRKREEQ